MRKVNQDPFSNGTEFDFWYTRNCECCIKDSHLNKDQTGYTKVKCAVQRDIFTRMVGNEPIAQRTIDICAMHDCPYRKENWPRRRKTDKHKNEPKLF